MGYTKGEWKANKNWFGTWTIYTDDAHIADVDRHFNANLVAAAPDMREELVEARGWLSGFVMKFYISAETPTYEKMKKLYQELDAFQRELGVKALAKADGK